MAVVLENDQWEVPVLLVNVYFPPGYSKPEFDQFLSDFEELLKALKKKYKHIIFTGDLNIHMDDLKQESETATPKKQQRPRVP